MPGPCGKEGGAGKKAKEQRVNTIMIADFIVDATQVKQPALYFKHIGTVSKSQTFNSTGAYSGLTLSRAFLPILESEDWYYRTGQK